MPKIYALLGHPYQQIGGDCPAGWQVMAHPRPSPDYVAGSDGVWHPSTSAVEALRLQAYADPLTGCDRHFAEATRLAAMGAPAAEVEAARTAGAERYLAIQQEYPYP